MADVSPNALYETLFKKKADRRSLYNALVDEWEPGQILPIQRNRITGDYDWAVPKAMTEMIEASMAPGKALRGEYGLSADSSGRVSYVGMAEDAATLAGSLAGGGAATAPMRGPGLGIFGGVMAKTADKAALKVAQEMAEKGATRKEIWEATGWFKGTDGKWRFEIDDSASKFDAASVPKAQDRFDIASQWLKENSSGGRDVFDSRYPEDARKQALVYADKHMNDPRYSSEAVPLGQALRHDVLYDAYPDIADIPLKQETRHGLRGSYNEKSNEMTTGGGGLITDDASPFSTALHEADHAVQAREGFSYGSNVVDARELLDDTSLFESALTWRVELEAIARANPGKTIQELEAMAAKNYSDLGATVPSTRVRYIAKSAEGYPTDLMEKTVREVLAGRSAKPAGLWGEADARDAYKRHAGEVSARNVQTRMNMTPAERRAKAPWETQDVPDERQIIRGVK